VLSVEWEWALDADAEECEENETLDAGGEVGRGTSCGCSWDTDGGGMGWEG
jgi:hypothetical protein